MLDCHVNNQQAANYCHGNLDLTTFYKGPPTYINTPSRTSAPPIGQQRADG